MKRMIAPMRQLKGQASTEQFRSLVLYHAGKRKSLYDESYEEKGAPYPRLMGYYLPPFQRPEVWTIQQKTKFIESVFLGFDIGRLVISSNFANGTDGWLIDGQQRLTAIRDFVENKFSIFNEIFYADIIAEGFDYEGDSYQFDHGQGKVIRLTPKYHWEGTYFNILILKDCSVEELKEAYFRLNYGGTPHSAEDMKLLGDKSKPAEWQPIDTAPKDRPIRLLGQVCSFSTRDGCLKPGPSKIETTGYWDACKKKWHIESTWEIVITQWSHLPKLS